MLKKKKKKPATPKVQKQMQRSAGCLALKNICADVGKQGNLLTP